MEKKKVQRSKMQNGSFPYDHFFDLLSGKWKSCIMIAIDYEKHIHFNAFQKLWGISSKVLYTQLTELENDGLIVREKMNKEDKQTTQYVMTEKGKSVMPILKDIYLWALKDLKDKKMKIDPRSFEYYMPKDKKEKLETEMAQYTDSAEGKDHTADDKSNGSGENHTTS